MTLVEKVNLEFYEKRYADENLVHKYPNINTVRCERWHFRKRPPGKVLDYGFGHGREAIYFVENHYDVYGVEISKCAEERLKRLLRRSYPKLAKKIKTYVIPSSTQKLPFRDNFFDFIHSNEVVCHLPSEEAIKRLMREWGRILKPGGKFMFSTIGPGHTFAAEGKKIGQNIYEIGYKTPDMKTGVKMRAVLLEDPRKIRKICEPCLTIEEVGWFTNHYFGQDGFYWQVLGEKSSPK